MSGRVMVGGEAGRGRVGVRRGGKEGRDRWRGWAGEDRGGLVTRAETITAGAIECGFRRPLREKKEEARGEVPGGGRGGAKSGLLTGGQEGEEEAKGEETARRRRLRR
jgi:hypothetical protein